MKKKISPAIIAGIVAAVLLGTAGIAVAGDSLRTRVRDGFLDMTTNVIEAQMKTQTRARTQLTSETVEASATPVKKMIRTRSMVQETSATVEPVKLQTRTQLRDGSGDGNKGETQGKGKTGTSTGTAAGTGDCDGTQIEQRDQDRTTEDGGEPVGEAPRTRKRSGSGNQ